MYFLAKQGSGGTGLFIRKECMLTLEFVLIRQQASV